MKTDWSQPVPAKSKVRELAELTKLAKDIVSDCEGLVTEHVALLRGEVEQEIDHAKKAALHAGPGVSLIAASGVLSIVSGVHLLHRTTRLPLWTCYGLMAGTLGFAGIRLLASGRREAEQVQLLPQTAATLKEDAAWLKESLPPWT